jgi:hypothetical protein
MKYPVFHYEKFSYVFVPDKPVTDLMLDQLEELYFISCGTKPCYVFVGLDTCYVLSHSELDIKDIPIDQNIPDVHDLINFDENVADEYSLTSNKKTKELFKEQMVNILNKLNNLNVTLIVT